MFTTETMKWHRTSTKHASGYGNIKENKKTGDNHNSNNSANGNDINIENDKQQSIKIRGHGINQSDKKRQYMKKHQRQTPPNSK